MDRIEKFLLELIDKNKKGGLSKSTLMLIGQMYVDEKVPPIIEEENVMKYYTMGWYIYNILNSEKLNSVNEN